jgi:hypothetical protein
MMLSPENVLDAVRNTWMTLSHTGQNMNLIGTSSGTISTPVVVVQIAKRVTLDWYLSTAV